jgi:hypothetical protein
MYKFINKQYKDKISLYKTSETMESSEYDYVMRKHTKADGHEIKMMIKKQIPSLYKSLSLNEFNPYERVCRRTKEYYVYVHKAVEYFLKRD